MAAAWGLVKAADGYPAVFSPAELDPLFTDRVAGVFFVSENGCGVERPGEVSSRMVRRSYDSFDAADFEKCRERIVEILAGASAPVTTNEMAGQLQRSYDVAQNYCDRLNGEGKVRYVQAAPARWGWVIAP